MPAAHSDPPPGVPPKSSGTGLYLAGIVVLLGLTAALIVWKNKSSQPATPQTTMTVTASAAPPPPPQLQYAPPPPPKLVEDEPDAGAPEVKPTAKSSGAAVAPGPCSGKCEGTATGALQGSLRSTAQSAQGCYNRALRNSEVSGSMTVSVQVGPSGSVCSASLANDTVRSPEIASCVLGRFRGKSFPPPQGGCVTVNIPISFTIKQ